MVITEILISNFRSIKKLSWDVKPATVICGINSCGKSNILRALKFAFLPTYDVGKMVDSICSAALSPNAEAQIKLTFDKPTAALARVLGIPVGTSFTYEVKVKRNATMKTYLNGSLLDSETRAAFLAQVLIVYVPPLRDIGADGLAPFQKALSDSLSKMKGANSFNRQASSLKDIVRSRSKSLLSATQELSKSQLRVDELVVDTDGLDFKTLVPRVGIKFKISGRELSLDRLGTGHQSAVVLDLYRQLGETADFFTLYLFEEPDNHLHPTSLKAISADLVKCSKKANSQVFLTTHSPYLLNQFPVENYLALSVDLDRLTVRLKTKNPRNDRKMRDAFGRFGLTPAEALLSKKVLVVEGPNDVTLFRTLVELQTGCSAERQDILIVNAGGKNPLTQLAELLNELGVTWLAAFDWDASIDTRHPSFRRNLSVEEKTASITALTQIQPRLASISARKSTAAQKLVTALLAELAAPPAPIAPSFRHSELGSFMDKVHKLTGQQLAIVEAAVATRRPTQYRLLLDGLKVWLWSASPEDVLLNHTNSENAVEAAMIADPDSTLNAAIPPGPTRRSTLANYLHSLANRPEQMSTVLRQLSTAGCLNRKELKEAVSFVLN